MEYTKLGRTGLEVSRICLGCMSYGGGNRGNHAWSLGEEESRPFIKKALEAGINFFDTANRYSLGNSEEILGRAISDFARRDEVCGGVGNYNGYCNPEIDKLIEQQSMEANQEKRKHIVWEIERRLTEDDAKPLIFFGRGSNCWDPKVKGLTIMVNSIYNGWRMEDVWLDK